MNEPTPSQLKIERAFRQNPATKVQEMCGTVTEEQLLKEFLKSEGITE